MGSRTNFELQDAKGSIWLYSHWGGDSKESDFANALEEAKPRWGDTSYAMRIVISQLIGTNWTSEVGFGISSYDYGEESYEPLSANFITNTVKYKNYEYSFQEFIDKYR